MGAAEEAQRRVVERLQAERDAVDPGGGEVGEARRLDRRGVGLERDLDVGREAPMASAASIRAATVAGGISDGVPPPKKIEPSRRPGGLSRFMGEVGEQRLAPLRLVDRLADMAVEVAIGAFGDAERPVDVERQIASVIPAKLDLAFAPNGEIPAFAGIDGCVTAAPPPACGRRRRGG